MARTDPKPSGSLTVLKTGQYANLTGLWAWNDLTNLANPGTGDAILQGAAQVTVDAIGAALQGSGDAANYASTGLAGADLGIGGNSPRTIFGRVKPITGLNAGGFFSYGAGAPARSLTVRNTGGGTANYQLDLGWHDIYGDGSAPLDTVATFVVTHDGAVVTFHINGVSMGSLTLALDTGADALFQIGRYKFGSATAQNNFAWHGLVYECGTIGGVAWSDAEVAAYDAGPVAMLATGSTPPASPTPHGRRAALSLGLGL